jgi:hypothetical protein
MRTVLLWCVTMVPVVVFCDGCLDHCRDSKETNVILLDASVPDGGLPDAAAAAIESRECQKNCASSLDCYLQADDMNRKTIYLCCTETVCIYGE